MQMPLTVLCRRCGAELLFTPGDGTVLCQHCRSCCDRPQVTGDALETLNHAVKLRLSGDFPSAIAAYDAVLAQSPQESSALWGRLLCRYDVAYVPDARTGRRFMVRRLLSGNPIGKQSDFLRACEQASLVVRRQYLEDAAYIDGVIEAYADLRKARTDYDVFLCCQSHDSVTGDMTADGQRAHTLYTQMREMGLRVFYAPECIPDVTGAQREAQISAALFTCRIMLIVGSRGEYLNSPWVRNEWRRFLLRMEEEPDTLSLVPVFFSGTAEQIIPQAIRERSSTVINLNSSDAEEQLHHRLAQSAQRKKKKKSGSKFLIVLFLLILLAAASAFGYRPLMDMLGSSPESVPTAVMTEQPAADPTP